MNIADKIRSIIAEANAAISETFFGLETILKLSRAKHIIGLAHLRNAVKAFRTCASKLESLINELEGNPK